MASLEPGYAAVAIGAHARLLRSPVLRGDGISHWTPAQLPGAAADSRGAIAVSSQRLTAVMANGDVLNQTGTSWKTIATPANLAKANIRIDSVTWASATLGWVTGHGPAGGAMAFQTVDAGNSWKAIRPSGGNSVAALSPCGSGSSWYLPVIDASGSEKVFHTVDSGRDWTGGGSLEVQADTPAWSCHGSSLWAAAQSNGSEHVFTSDDGGQRWADHGSAPAHLTALYISEGGMGFAASGGKHAMLWSVSNNATRFSRIALPSWVAIAGGQASGD
jgi:hypothetical protein